MSAVDERLKPCPRRTRRAPAARALAVVAATSAVFGLTVFAPATMAGEAMREVRDPVTGEVRGPTAAEVAAFQKAEAQLRAVSGKKPSPAPVEVHHADGTVETKLGEDTMMYSVVRAADDGSLTMACLPADEARAFVMTPRKAKPSTSAATAAAKASAKAHHAHD